MSARVSRQGLLAADDTVGPTPPLGQGGLQQLRGTYLKVMVGYCAALGEAARVGRRQGLEPAPAGRRRMQPLGHGVLVRLMTGSHVRKQLTAVAARCAQLELTLDSKRDTGSR